MNDGGFQPQGQPQPKPSYNQPQYAQQYPDDNPVSQPILGCDFPTAVKRYWTGYVRMRGRASRSEYWFSVLFNILVYIVIGILVAIVGDGLGFLSPLYGLATIIPTITITVRRFHDSDKSGLWLLLLYILYAVAVIVGVVGVGGALAGGIIGISGGDYGMLGGSVGLLVFSIILVAGTGIAQLVLVCLPSKESGKRFD